MSMSHSVDQKKFRSILVVDDDEAVTGFLKTLIEKKTPYKVTCFTNPVVALESIKQTQYDLVITDIDMPEMSGLELLHKVRTALPNLEVVVLTGNASVDRAVESLQQRAYDFIEKPVPTDRLIRVIGNAITKQELSSQVDEMMNQVIELNKRLRDAGRKRLEVQGSQERLIVSCVVVDLVERFLEGRTGITSTGLDALARTIEGEVVPLTEPVSSALATLREYIGGTGKEFSQFRAFLTANRPKRTRGDVNQTVGRAVREVLDLYPLVKATIRVPDAAALASFNEMGLAAAVTNLVDNAVQAIKGQGAVEVSVEQNPDQVQIFIEDDGPGFPSGMTGDTIQPFWSTKGQGFSGLGLSIAHWVAHEHGGSLRLGSSARGGARVVLTLQR